MSPRRRLVLLAAVLLLAGLVAAFAVPRLVDRLRADERGVPAQDRPGPVLLVPGYGGGTGALEVLAERIRATGRSATVVPLPGDGTGDLRAQAAALDRAVSDALGPAPNRSTSSDTPPAAWSPASGPRSTTAGSAPGASSPSAHRTTVRRSRRSVRWRCPARARPRASSWRRAAACSPACRRRCRPPPAWLSVWTAQDQTVVPPDSARLDGRGQRRAPVGVPDRADWPRRPADRSDRDPPGARRDRPAAAGAHRRRAGVSGLDVLGGEVGPRRGEEHRHVDGLDGQPALDVPPRDRVAEQVDPGQPVAGRQVRRRPSRPRPASTSTWLATSAARAPSAAPSGESVSVDRNSAIAPTPSIDTAT